VAVVERTTATAAVLTKAARDNVQTVREHFIDLLSPSELETIGRAFQAVAAKIRQSAD
jgi:hypothetical protein